MREAGALICARGLVFLFAMGKALSGQHILASIDR
jgi:hypothetical protein